MRQMEKGEGGREGEREEGAEMRGLECTAEERGEEQMK